MSDLAAYWPLLLAAAVAVAFALGNILLQERRWNRARLIAQAAAFALVSFVLVRLVGSPVAPALAAGGPRRLLEQAVAALWWVMAARTAVVLARLLLTREARPRESRILLDLLAGVVYVSALLAVVAFVLGIPVSGLVATSGVIAIVLGLALQNTLGDLFSGIAVGVERPYRVGDQLSVDGGANGHVVQVNWRSTHIRAGHDLLVIPNSVIAKSRLVNHSQPTASAGEKIAVRVHPEVPPAHVVRVLRAALLSCDGLADDKATAFCSDLAGDGATYTLSFAAPSLEDVGAIRSDVLQQVHRHLLHAGIPLAVAGMQPGAGWQARTFSGRELLARSDLFSALSDLSLDRLAAHLAEVELDAGDAMFRQGEPPRAMFVLASGTIEVTVEQDGSASRRHVFAPGESVGLVAVVTAEPYRTTARALVPVRALSLDADGLAAALSEAPDLAGELEAAVARALSIMSRFDAHEEAREGAHRGALLRRLRALLGAMR